MSTEQKPHKLYCYVDETGQDTQGELFIVLTVVVATERNELDGYLQHAESTSGIHKKKWTRAKAAGTACQQYLRALTTADLNNKLFYTVYKNTGTGAYQSLTVLSIAQAVNRYRDMYQVGDYKLTVIIDGLTRSEEVAVSKQLRELGIKAKKVRGARDESEPLIRLADRIAGLVRDSLDNTTSYDAEKRQLEKQKIINKL